MMSNEMNQKWEWWSSCITLAVAAVLAVALLSPAPAGKVDANTASFGVSSTQILSAEQHIPFRLASHGHTGN